MALPNEPITRQEMYLSNIAGQNTALPDAPITREEMYLDYIAKTGGTGEGDMKKSIYDSDNSVATAGGIKMFVNQKIGTIPQKVGTLETKVSVLEGEVASIEDDLDALGTASTKNSTSVVTESSDLVESGAVKEYVDDAVGWDVKELYDIDNVEIGTAWNGTPNPDRARCVIPIVGGNTYVLRMNGTNTLDGIYYISSPTTIPSLPMSANFPQKIPTASTDNYIVLGFNKTNITKADIDKAKLSLKHINVDEQKCNNSVIGTVEDGTTASQAYAVRQHFIRGGKFCTVTQAISSGGTLTEGTNYTVGDVASEFGLYIPITNNAGFHNSIFRGKNLGSSVTTAQKTAIANGTFEDMYIGDYWEINSVKYRIAHFDYWLNCGDTQCTTHHVVVVPDSALVSKRMNDANTTAGAYVNSEMRTTNLADAKTIVNTAFGADNILGHREYMQNAVTDGYESAGAWVNADIELMSEIMVYGSNIFHNVMCGTVLPNLNTVNKTQLALFRLDPSYIICKNVAQTDRSSWWLRDVASAMNFAIVANYGIAYRDGASNSAGVRPAFGIK